jgi:hypothetical protein
MYNMCAQMNKEDKDMLWCWIVGMTDLIVNAKTGTYD